MKTPIVRLRFVGIIGLILSMIMIFNFSTLNLILFNFYAGFLGASHPVSKVGSIAIQNVVILINLSILLISLVFLFFKEIKRLLSEFIDTEKAFRFFMTDEQCSKKQLPVFLFLIASALGVFFNLFQLTFGEPAKEGFMEDNTTLLYVVAGIVLFIAAFLIKRDFFSKRERNTILILLFLLIVMLVFLFGEEVSWGQRVLGIKSVGVFQEYNYQKELNLHNFFNPLFKYAYPLAGMSFFVVLLFMWLFDKKDKPQLFYIFCPSRSLFFLAFFMAASTYHGHSEIFEEMVSVFSLLYSIRVFFCLRYPAAKTQLKLD